jgi:hypothetical protein
MTGTKRDEPHEERFGAMLVGSFSGRTSGAGRPDLPHLLVDERDAGRLKGISYHRGPAQLGVNG